MRGWESGAGSGSGELSEGDVVLVGMHPGLYGDDILERRDPIVDALSWQTHRAAEVSRHDESDHPLLDSGEDALILRCRQRANRPDLILRMGKVFRGV